MNLIISEEILINYFICYFLGGQAGAMDEDSFIQAFEDVKKLSIFNGRDVTQELSKIKVNLMYLRYRTNIFKKVAPRLSFSRHTQRSRIKKWVF